MLADKGLIFESLSISLRTTRYNIQKFYMVLALRWGFCMDLRTNSDLGHLHHILIGFYNPDEKCLQRGTDWVYKYSGLRFVFRELMQLF